MGIYIIIIPRCLVVVVVFFLQARRNFSWKEKKMFVLIESVFFLLLFTKNESMQLLAEPFRTFWFLKIFGSQSLFKWNFQSYLLWVINSHGCLFRWLLKRIGCYSSNGWAKWLTTLDKMKFHRTIYRFSLDVTEQIATIILKQINLFKFGNGKYKIWWR